MEKEEEEQEEEQKMEEEDEEGDEKPIQVQRTISCNIAHNYSVC